MDNLYYGDNCSCCDGFHNAGIRFSPDILEAFLDKIYDGFDTGSGIEPAMWREVLRLLNEATAEGVSRAKTPPTHEEGFYRALRQSNEVFAAFKVHSMGEKMAAKLMTPEGKLKTFKQWAEDVKGISSHYVGSWLKTEYDTAIIRAHTAADWQRFEQDKDIMPNLRWLPTTSLEPDSKHRVFWLKELTLPVDHPFWSKHHPGDRWNCKCMLEQTDEPANPEVLDEIDATPAHRGLENNPGKDGHLFNDTHPYFPANCKSCTFYKPGFKDRLKYIFNNRAKDCYDCPYLKGCLPGEKKIKKQRDEQHKAVARLKEFKETIDPFNGVTIENDEFITGSLTLLRRSMQDVYEHNREDIRLMKWLQKFDLSAIKGWKYQGWAENRPYSPNHPKFDPNNPDRKKHPETEYFTYYSLKIGRKNYWANVKVHKVYGEVLYTIEEKKPDDLIPGIK